MSGQHTPRSSRAFAEPAALYGPNSDLVLRFLEDLRRPRLWTEARTKACGGTVTGFSLRHAAARRATRLATRGLQDREAQRASALNRAWDEAAVHEDTTERCGWAAGWAAAALTVRDLIHPKHLQTLTAPFADLMVRYAAIPAGGPLPTSALPTPTTTTRHGDPHMPPAKTAAAKPGAAKTTTATPRSKPPAELRAHRKLTQAELTAEATERFGPDPRGWAFQCPRCGDIAVVADFPKGEEARIGQECVGRWRGALKGTPNDNAGQSTAERGCDWTAYGLFRGPWEIVMPDGRSVWGFPLAPASVAAVPVAAETTTATPDAEGEAVA